MRDHAGSRPSRPHRPAVQPLRAGSRATERVPCRRRVPGRASVPVPRRDSRPGDGPRLSSGWDNGHSRARLHRAHHSDISQSPSQQWVFADVRDRENRRRAWSRALSAWQSRPRDTRSHAHGHRGRSGSQDQGSPGRHCGAEPHKRAPEERRAQPRHSHLLGPCQAHRWDPPRRDQRRCHRARRSDRRGPCARFLPHLQPHRVGRRDLDVQLRRVARRLHRRDRRMPSEQLRDPGSIYPWVDVQARHRHRRIAGWAHHADVDQGRHRSLHSQDAWRSDMHVGMHVS